MSVIETLDSSCSKVNIDVHLIANLEKLLDTKFFNVNEFFELDDEDRVLGELFESYSSIGFTRESADDEHPPKEPRLFFPALNMSLNVQEDDTGWFRYYLKFNEADGERLEADYDTEYPELTIQNINLELKDQRFVELQYGLWFLVPNNVSIDELNALLNRPKDS